MMAASHTQCILRFSRDRCTLRLIRTIVFSNIFVLSFVFLNTTTTELYNTIDGAIADAPQILAASPASSSLLSSADNHNLGSVKHRYYIYNSTALNALVRSPHNGVGDHWHKPVWSMYEALAKHPLRTHNPNEATFFIPPLFVNQIDARPNKGQHHREIMKRAFDMVTGSQIYQETGGARHIIIAFDSWYFNRIANYGFSRDLKYHNPQWAFESYNPLFWDDMDCTYEKYMLGRVDGAGGCQIYWNLFNRIILVRERDVWENNRMIAEPHVTKDFKDLIAYDLPILQRGFSVGLMSGPNEVPLIIPDYSRYVNSTTIYFYHSRTEPSGFDSTKYRHAPMTQLPESGTPESETYNQSSIGFSIDATEWKYKFTHSKYCLVIRGDNPGSRALMRSVRVGCIPVIISDLFPRYAPSFKSTLRSMSEYAILVDEETFLANPWGELHRIHNEMTEEEVRRKLKGIAFAQQVMFPDHPESLFVEAFLNEAWMTLSEEEQVAGCGIDNDCTGFEDTDILLFNNKS